MCNFELKRLIRKRLIQLFGNFLFFIMAFSTKHNDALNVHRDGFEEVLGLMIFHDSGYFTILYFMFGTRKPLFQHLTGLSRVA